MAEVPLELPTGRVVGKFIFEVQDNNDPGEDPQLVPVTGDVTVKSAIDNLTIFDQSLGKFITFRGPHKAVINSEGELATPHPVSGEPMYTGMSLWSNDSDNLSVKGWTYTATFNLKTADGRALHLPPVSFTLATGQEIDLADVIKVPATPGYGLPQAEGAALRAEAAAQVAGTAAQSAEASAQSAATSSQSAAQVAQSVRDDADAGLFDGDKGDKGDPGGLVQTSLSSSTHLDTVTTVGLYRFSDGTADASTLGYPKVAFIGSIMVLARATDSRILQIAYPQNGDGFEGRVYYERGIFGNNTWTPWRAFVSTRVDNTAGKAIYQWDDTVNREQLIYGDTGLWHLTLATGSAGAFNIRRIGNQVEIRLVGFTSSVTKPNILAVALPPGLRPGNTITAISRGSNGTDLCLASLDYLGTSLTVEGLTTGNVSFVIQYLTSDPWPTKRI